jgi:arginyl-tRNA---protein transferase
MYHRLDGKLVAVGNLDLLQESLNSGYFIYDPDYKFLNLGVIGALREV